MAEQGTDKTEETESEPRVIEEAPQNEFDRTFNETMAEDGDTPAAEGGDKGGTDEGKAEGTGQEPPEVPEKPAEVKPQDEGKVAPDAVKPAEVKPEVLSADDKAFLKSLNIVDEDVTPKEVVRLKRIHGDFTGKVSAAEKKALFFGGEAKKVSEKYQTIRKAYKEIIGQQTPMDRIKGVISKIDMSKLSDPVKDLLNDPAYIESSALLLQALGVKPAESIPGLEDDETPAPTDKTPGAPAATPEPTEAEAIAQIDKNIQNIKASLKDKHADLEEHYASPRFRTWIDKQSQFEVAKLFSPDPRAHDELLTRYKSELAGELAQAEEAKKNDKASDDLRSHQSPNKAGGGKPRVSEADPGAMSDEDFDKLTSSISTRRVHTG